MSVNKKEMLIQKITKVRNILYRLIIIIFYMLSTIWTCLNLLWEKVELVVERINFDTKQLIKQYCALSEALMINGLPLEIKSILNYFIILSNELGFKHQFVVFHTDRDFYLLSKSWKRNWKDFLRVILVLIKNLCTRGNSIIHFKTRKYDQAYLHFSFAITKINNKEKSQVFKNFGKI